MNIEHNTSGQDADARELAALLDRAGDRLLARAQRDTPAFLPAPIAKAVAQRRASLGRTRTYIIPLALAADAVLAACLAWIALVPHSRQIGARPKAVAQIPAGHISPRRDPVRVLEELERIDAAAALASKGTIGSAAPVSAPGSLAPLDAWRGQRIEP